jgi:hypothetical protein
MIRCHTLFVLLCSLACAQGELKTTKSNPNLKARGDTLLKEIVSQKWAAGWKNTTLDKIRLVAQKPDLAKPTGLPPVWSAIINGPAGKKGHLMWDSSGEGRLVEFSLDDKLEIKGGVFGLPALQQFPMKDEKGQLVASGCVPTAAASVVSYWVTKDYPQWSGEDGTTPKDLALRLRKKMKMFLFPDTDGFTPNRMPLAGTYPSELYKALKQDAQSHGVSMSIGLKRFSFEELQTEIKASRPALLSCVVRVAHQPELSWGHEVAAVGFCQIDEVELVGILDNFYPTKYPETIRWIRKDAFSSIVTLRPVLENQK